MPDKHGQVTEEDFKAPEGKHRIICEEMSDGLRRIVGEFNLEKDARVALKAFSSAQPRDIFTLCDDRGVIEITCGSDDDLAFEELVRTAHPWRS